MELETIMAQMKSVIQKHQMVVNELRNDPQNPILLKQLHELQCEIRSLNDRQKQVVEGLRKNLENNTNSTSNSDTSLSPRLQASNQEAQIICSQRSPTVNNKLTTTTIVTKPITNCINAVRQTVPPTLNNIATPTATTFTFKAPMGTVVLPNCSSAASTLLTTKVAEHQKMHPVLVVPSPSNRTADGPQTGVLFNLVPPIRVPQYPPRTPIPLACQKTPTLNNCIPVAVASTSTAFQPTLLSINSDSNLTSSSESPPVSLNEKNQPNHSPDVINNRLQQKEKVEFLGALGLVSKDSLTDMKNKKMERKRRSTANPQFSNAALEEKWRNAAAQAAAVPQKRPRGRPRLETKPVILPTNGISQTTVDKPADVQPQNHTVNSVTAANVSPKRGSPALINGIHKVETNSVEGKQKKMKRGNYSKRAWSYD